MWRALLVGLALACADVAPCVMHMNHDGVVYKVELRSGMDFESVVTKFVRQMPTRILGYNCDASDDDACIISRLRVAMEVEFETCEKRALLVTEATAAQQRGGDGDTADSAEPSAVVVLRGDTFRNGLRTCSDVASLAACSANCAIDEQTAALQLAALRSLDARVLRPLRRAGFATHLLAYAYAGCALDETLWDVVRAGGIADSFAVEAPPVARENSTQAGTAAQQPPASRQTCL